MTTTQAEGGQPDYIGAWVSLDGRFQEWLAPDGTFEDRSDGGEVRTGRYAVDGVFIFYWDSDDYTADGQFFGDMIDRGEYVLVKATS